MDHPLPARARRRRLTAGALAALVALLALATSAGSGCAINDPHRLRKIATLAGYATPSLVEVRRTPKNPLADQLQLLSWSGPQPSARTAQLLRRLDLLKKLEDAPQDVIRQLQHGPSGEPTAESMYAVAELAYVYGKRADHMGDDSRALEYYAASTAHAYQYLLDPQFDGERNPYDPEFRSACDLYNGGLEGALRIIAKRGQLQPGKMQLLKLGDKEYRVAVNVRGPWKPEDFESVAFISDYELKGLRNNYHTYGLGVPLIAVRKPGDSKNHLEKFYPPGLTFAVTAFLRVAPGHSHGDLSHCVLELWDPLASTDVLVDGRRVPLESDISTPLALFLNDPLHRTNLLATYALLNADLGREFQGLYMLEPYDPAKIPVIMVHGLWSSPVTWMDMFNDLRALPDLRARYQFWFYMYPTGQPFWISAAQFREDLNRAAEVLDPQRQSPSLDQMVLVGHSMGGLVSRLQTVESGEDYWRILSDEPFDELQADDATRQQLARTLYFRPNPSVRRVITLGTPHRGSNFANTFTRFAGRKLIMLPNMLTSTSQKIVRDNPKLFRNTELLTISTSIDSLAPDSPIFPVLEQSPPAPWVKYHNVVGRAPNYKVVDYLAGGEGDGVVPLASAQFAGAESQVEIAADHVTIHAHPRSILEVERILREHLRQVDAELAASQPHSSY